MDPVKDTAHLPVTQSLNLNYPEEKNEQKLPSVNAEKPNSDKPWKCKGGKKKTEYTVCASFSFPSKIQFFFFCVGQSDKIPSKYMKVCGCYIITV